MVTSSSAHHRRGDGHRRDHAADVGLENVRSHAGDVADVVADVVGDDAGIARVVLGNTGLDLADEVRADVGGLGEDASADPGEEGDRRGSHGKAPDDLNVVGTADEIKKKPKPQQAERGDGQPHHRAAAEGHIERPRHVAVERRGGRSDVGLGRGLHADEPGHGGRDGAEDECAAHPHVVLEGEEDGDHQDEQRDADVLLAQIGHRTEMDRLADFLHPVVAGRFSRRP